MEKTQKTQKFITTAQMRKLYAEAREHGLSNDELHAMVYQRYSKESLKQLTAWEAARLIDWLVMLRGGGKNPLMITDQQKWRIEDYQKKLGWTDRQLQLFIRKYGHTYFVQWLTKENASKMIEALKNVYSRIPKEGLEHVH